jgi:SAM-dependent methyltransferase
MRRSIEQTPVIGGATIYAASSPGDPADIARVGYWESVWKRKTSVRKFSRLSYYDFRLAQVFATLLMPGARVIEIGCGGSRWIGYFAERLHCDTWGIDYSADGLRLTARSNAGNPIIHLIAGDFFDESLLPREFFDLIYSRGFIEHFSRSARVTRRMGQILRPGGSVVTMIPNFISFYGAVQKLANREIFDKHLLLDRALLDDAHRAAGLKPVLPAEFFGCFGPGVVNYGPGKGFLLPPIKLAQQAVCWTLRALRLDLESRIASPYILGVYRKPA